MSGLKLFLPFEGTAEDYSGEGNDGTVTGAVYVAGKHGQALDFDGSDDKVAVGDVLDFAGQLPFTMMAWVKPEVVSAAMQIVFKMSGFDGWEFYVLATGEIRIVRWENPSHKYAQSTTQLVAGTWYHVAATYNSAELQCYVNGAADGSSTADTLTVADTAGELTVGRQNAAALEPFNGVIDEVRIYNRVLSSDEIRLLYEPSASAFFDDFLNTLKSSPLGENIALTADVPLRSITLGSRNATTGWRAVTYPVSVIEMALVPKGTFFTYLGVGFYARHSALGLTRYLVKPQDQIYVNNRFYKVVAVEPYDMLNRFIFRAVHLEELPLWQSAPQAATWQTTPTDPRKKTKDWIDTYARSAQITKDDGSTAAAWACMFDDPPYTIDLEYRAAASPVFGLYVVGQPNSSLELGVRYDEKVPIDIYCADSVGVSGGALAWKMEAELRYVMEQKPHGSIRTLDTRKASKVWVGSDRLYHIPTVLNYRRTSEWGKA